MVTVIYLVFIFLIFFIDLGQVLLNHPNKAYGLLFTQKLGIIMRSRKFKENRGYTIKETRLAWLVGM